MKGCLAEPTEADGCVTVAARRAEVLHELPAKQERVVSCAMLPEQRAAYVRRGRAASEQTVTRTYDGGAPRATCQ